MVRKLFFSHDVPVIEMVRRTLKKDELNALIPSLMQRNGKKENEKLQKKQIKEKRKVEEKGKRKIKEQKSVI